MNYIQVKNYIYTAKHWPKKAKSPENDEVHCERGADAHLQEALQLLADDLVVEDAARHGQTGPLGLLHHALTHTHTHTEVTGSDERLPGSSTPLMRRALVPCGCSCGQET